MLTTNPCNIELMHAILCPGRIDLCGKLRLHWKQVRYGYTHSTCRTRAASLLCHSRASALFVSSLCAPLIVLDTMLVKAVRQRCSCSSYRKQNQQLQQTAQQARGSHLQIAYDREVANSARHNGVGTREAAAESEVQTQRERERKLPQNHAGRACGGGAVSRSAWPCELELNEPHRDSHNVMSMSTVYLETNKPRKSAVTCSPRYPPGQTLSPLPPKYIKPSATVTRTRA